MHACMHLRDNDNHQFKIQDRKNETSLVLAIRVKFYRDIALYIRQLGFEP